MLFGFNVLLIGRIEIILMLGNLVFEKIDDRFFEFKKLLLW